MIPPSPFRAIILKWNREQAVSLGQIPGFTVFTGTDVTELKSGPIQGGTDLDELSFRTYYCVHIIHYADLIMGEKSSS